MKPIEAEITTDMGSKFIAEFHVKSCTEITVEIYCPKSDTYLQKIDGFLGYFIHIHTGEVVRLSWYRIWNHNKQSLRYVYQTLKAETERGEIAI